MLLRWVRIRAKFCSNIVVPLDGRTVYASGRCAAFGRPKPHRFAARRGPGAAIKRAERLKDLVDVDGRLQSFWRPQRRAGRDRGGVGGPRSEDGSLLGKREARMRNN